MTPVELSFARDMGGRFGIDGESIRSPQWEFYVNWNHRAVYCKRGSTQICVPFEACIIRYTGATPKGPGRPEKGGS